MDSPSTIARVHYELINGLLERGQCPDAAELSKRLGNWAVDDTRNAVRELAGVHGVVLHPHAVEPWVVHPFSTTPTLNWIEGPRFGWWAPCVWCAFGVAALVKGEVRIATRWGGEGEPLTIAIRDGEPITPDEILVHFAIPPRRAWDNVHQHCAMVLPFRSETEIAEWCVRHGLPCGEAVPVRQVARLARLWYGRHAERDWKKWSGSEAQAIFREAGLTSPFWDLEVAAGHF